MDTAVRWSSLVTPLFINTTSGIVVCQNQRLQNSFLHGRTHWSCWSAQKWCGHRGEFLKIGALEENVPELLVNGTNVFGTLALQLPNNEEDGGSILSDQISRAADFTHQDDDESNELYEKLAVNSLRIDPVSCAEEAAAGSEDDSDFEESPVEVETGQVETWIASTPYQQASRLLIAVNKSLDGLEDGLVRHAEELEASALSEDYLALSGENSKGEVQRARDIEFQTRQVEQLQEEIKSRDALLELLKCEAIQASQSLRVATQAMVAARKKISSLQEQVDTTVSFLDQEKEATQNALELFSKALLALSVAEDRVKEMERQVGSGHQPLQQEKELIGEIASLKGLVESKEKMIEGIREETLRNANMLLSAAKTRDGLTYAEKQVNLLTAQVNTLEEEVRSRDALLQEVKDEMVRSTDVLKLAAQIKQDLNATKQRELALNQELESEREIVKSLRQEIAENHRAMRSEQALRKMEKMLKDAAVEVEVLRKGLEARDEALRAMKEEVDRSVDVLSHAAENREAVQLLTGYVGELRLEIKIKDDELASLREELALAVAQQHTPAAGSTLVTPVSGAGAGSPLRSPSPPLGVEAAKPKEKPSRRKQGNNRKPFRQP